MIYIITSNGNFITEDELYHHGTKGMKWGVRRYQNEDGSLTSAGKNRNKMANKKRATSGHYHPNKSDEEVFGKRGAQRIANRRNKGQPRQVALAKELGITAAKTFGYSAFSGAAIMDLMSHGALHRAVVSKIASSKVVNAGKKAFESFFNAEVLDASGKVIKRFHMPV